MAGYNKGAIVLELLQDRYNYLMTILNTFVQVSANNPMGKTAQDLIDKIMKYGKEITTDNGTAIKINIYPREAKSFIELFIFYDSIFEKPDDDYFRKFFETRAEKNKLTE